jgi:hypothetical protein
VVKDPATYARALATLTRQVHDQASLVAIRDTLRVVGTHSRVGDTTFALDERGLLVDDAPVDAPDTDSLLESMRAHGVEAIVVEQEVAPKELLLLATLLAGSFTEGSPSIMTLADDLGLWHVRLNGRSSPASAPVVAPAAVPTVTHPVGRSFASVDDATTYAAELGERAQAAVESGNAQEVAATLRWLVEAEAFAKQNPAQQEIGALWTATFDELATLASLRCVATLLVNGHADTVSLMAVLHRAGDAGASAVVAHMIAAPTLRERRMLFDAIRELRSGVSVLMRNLDHPQWFVVRNAASLLGELRAPEAEGALALLLKHGDARVRVAAVGSIGKLAGASAHRTLERALRDGAAEVRRQAFYVLVGRGEPIAPAALADALEAETNVNTQLDMLEALARSSTPDALRKLAWICSHAVNTSSDPLFRIAAVEALLRAKPSAALPYLRRLAEDRDPAVRARARQLVSSIGSPPPAVSA